MRFVLVVLLAACGGKQEAPPIGSIDRSCKLDADCTLTGDPSCCGTSCGRETGSAVNVRAWSKVSAQMRAHCKGEQCAVMCPKLPDCRDEAFAVCKAGTCEKELRKTEACAVDPKLACTSKADCVLVTRGDDCCDRCDGTAMTVAAAAAENARIDELCATKIVKCPHVDCPAMGADCVDGKCVKTP